MSASSIPLKTLNEKGQPPKARIPTAADARMIVGKLIDAGRERSVWNGRIKGQIDGNPPFGAGRLRGAGQGWRTNINFGEAKSALSNALIPYYDLFASSRYYFNVRTYYGSAEDREYYSGVVSEEFDCMLKKYEGFDFNIQQMLYDRTTFGRGFLIWEDDRDWFFKCKRQHRIYVPDGSDAYSGNQDIIVIREEARVHKLWGYIKDRKTATDAGWKPKQVVAAIVNARPEIAEQVASGFNYELVQQSMKDRDVVEGMRCATVPMAYVLTREFDGKITLQIVEEHDARRVYAKSPSEPGAQLSDDFLYEKTGYCDELSQFIATFFLETADGSWNGASGLGRDIYSLMAIKDRVKCSALDLVFLRTGITVQATTEDAVATASLIQIGGMNVIPPNFQIQQSQIMGDIESPFMADRYLDNTVASNTGVYRTQIDKPSGNPRTLGEVQLQYQVQASLGSSSVNRFYLEGDKFGTELYRRASAKDQSSSKAGKLAKEFQKRCEEKGVPREALEKVEYVRAYRNSGNGSIALRQQNLANMSAIVPMLPESGKDNWVQDTIAALNGQSMVERYFPVKEKPNMPNDHQALALLENSAIKNNSPVLVTGTQQHVVHLQTHLQSAAQAAASVQEGADIGQVAEFIDGIGKHSTMHLKELAADPSRKSEFKLLEGQVEALAKIHDQFSAMLQQQQQSQAQQQQEQEEAAQKANAISNGADPGTQIKAAEVAAKIQLQQLKTNAGISMKEQKQRHAMALSDASTSAKIIQSNRLAIK